MEGSSHGRLCLRQELYFRLGASANLAPKFGQISSLREIFISLGVLPYIGGASFPAFTLGHRSRKRPGAIVSGRYVWLDH